jgi:hypothetical protein
MAMEALQKQQKNSTEIVKQLYLDSQDKAIAQMLDIVCQTYLGIELTAGLVSFWKEALKELSPQQLREGLLRYMKSERGNFKPTPADIIGNAPEATDRPRKVMNPKCPDCSGTGFRMVLVDSKIHEGRKAQRATDCFCVAIEYEGQQFKPEQKALPAAPEVDPKELLQRIGKKTGVTLERKFPARKDLDLDRNAEKLRQQAEILKGKP